MTADPLSHRSAPASQYDQMGDAGNPSEGKSLLPLALLLAGIVGFLVLSDGPKRERYS